MPYKTRPARKSMLSALAFGLGVNWAVTLLSAIVITCIVSSDRGGEGVIAPAAVATMLAATAGGTATAAGQFGERRVAVCLISGGAYFASLLCCNALFFEGEYRGVVPALLTVAGCSLVMGLAGLRPKRNKFKVAKAYRKS